MLFIFYLTASPFCFPEMAAEGGDTARAGAGFKGGFGRGRDGKRGLRIFVLWLFCFMLFYLYILSHHRS